MPVIQGGRWQRAIQKYFGIKGEVVASELAPEIYATIDIENQPFENRILYGWQSYTFDDNRTGDATHPCQLGIHNPLTSNVLAVIERVQVHDVSSVAPVLQLRIIAGTDSVGGLTTSGRGVLRDFRNGGTRNNSACFCIFATTLAAQGTVFGDFPPELFPTALGAVFQPIIRPTDQWVLAPGETHIYTSNINAENHRWIIQWRERALEPSEATA